MAQHNIIGKIGEDIATKWLLRKNFHILERNYLKKYGEIDIVARETSGIIHFMEVKTVSYETAQRLEYAVTHETWRPEEMVHEHKQARFKRVIETWLAEYDPNYELDWQIDIITVRVVPREKLARIKWLKNIIFE